MTDSPSLARRVARIILEGQLWRPSHLSLFSSGYLARERNATSGYTDADHLRAAAAWLCRAQDATVDGGVAGRFRLEGEWSSSYPETTGYLVPTFLALDVEFPGEGFRARAQRCVEFLLGTQLPAGAFPGMEIAQNRTEASTFNSAQILNGLTAWHRATGEERVLVAARRAADWLVAHQDADGSWRKYLYQTTEPYSYMAHASCWIAEFGAHTGEDRYLQSARRHLEWVLTQVDPATGWIRRCGFFGANGGRESAHTHTIAYTIWGILSLSRTLGHAQGLEVARRAARAVARRMELSRTLPGMLDQDWRRAADYRCLTGNAQMALIWFDLHRLAPEPMLVSSALKALDEVKRAQPMHSSNPGIRGGIAGSDPVDGGYIRLAIPNWSAKFFIDALLAKREVVGALTFPRRQQLDAKIPPAVVPTSLPATAPRTREARPRIILVADEESSKVEQFHLAWREWGFVPDAVVVRQSPEESLSSRLRSYVRDHGVLRLVFRSVGVRAAAPTPRVRQGTIPWSRASVSEYCTKQGLPLTRVASWTEEPDLAVIRALRPDLIVFAGAGIMRRGILAIPPLGMLNAHMGLLPPMRGMNVAEWSALIGQPVGCTVHLIDEGIDTGDILLFTAVDIREATSVDQLRQIVDRQQIASLGDVVRWVLEHGELPPRRSQSAAEGRQLFAMHAEIRDRFDAALER